MGKSEICAPGHAGVDRVKFIKPKVRNLGEGC